MQYEAEVIAERKAREARHNQLETEQMLAEEERRKAAEAIALSRKAEFDKK